MTRQWVVIADKSRARIFEIDDLLNPEGRQSDAELRHDAKGRFYGKGERDQAHTAEPKLTREVHSADRFSREIMAYIENANREQRFVSLVMIAPPEFLGLLRRQLGKGVEHKLYRQLATDITGFQEPQIRAYLKKHLSHHLH
jgi:protein required for attachment to host cells